MTTTTTTKAYCQQNQMDDVFDNNNNTFVLGCGYREIQNPKTRNTFPVWWVRFGDCDNNNNDDDPPNNNNNNNNNNVWFRSKRDFGHLFRAVVRHCRHHSENEKGLSFLGKLPPPPPKAALEKLTNQAPWMRPSVDLSLLLLSMMNDNEEEEEEDAKDSSILSDATVANNYHASMKKSLLQIDQFLHALHRHFCQVTCSSSTATQPPDDDDDNDGLVKAWRIFCRPAHTDWLVEEDNEHNHKDVSPPNVVSATNSSVEKSSRLGQYFCTRENANQVSELMVFGGAGVWLCRGHFSFLACCFL